MAELELQHMHEDLEVIKREVSVLFHILSEEGELTEEARKTASSEYIEL